MLNNPHIIIEKGVEYHLGTLHGDTIRYDFQSILIYQGHKGKMLFGKNFNINEEVEVIIFKLCIYFIKDYEYYSKFNIDPNKGILLSGPVGCGKTSVLRDIPRVTPILRLLNPSRRREMICFKSIGSCVLAMSLVLGHKVIMLDLSKWHKSNRYRFLTHRQKWHSLNRNAWHYETEITGTNRTEVTNFSTLRNSIQF